MPFVVGDIGFNIPFVVVDSSGPFGNADGIASITLSPSHVLLICLYNAADTIVVHVGRLIAKILLCLLLPLPAANFSQNFVFSFISFSFISCCGSVSSLLRITYTSPAISGKNAGTSYSFSFVAFTKPLFVLKFAAVGQPVFTFLFNVSRLNSTKHAVLLLIAYVIMFPLSAPIYIVTPTPFLPGSIKAMQLPLFCYSVR